MLTDVYLLIIKK